MQRHSNHYCVLCEKRGHRENNCPNYVGDTNGMPGMKIPKSKKRKKRSSLGTVRLKVNVSFTGEASKYNQDASL